MIKKRPTVYKFLVTSILVTLCISIHSKDYYKWKKITDYEKKLTHCPYDSLANAVVIFNKGAVEVSHANVIYKTHKRIKIFNQKGLDEANISIYYYHKNNMERIRSIKAHTINFDSNGKKVITKVNKSEIYREKVNDRWSKLTFAFPNVKPGSIIEYKLNKYSTNYYSINEWKMQEELPVMLSKFKFLVSVNITYGMVYKGRRLINKYYRKKAPREFSLINLPALKKEPYSPNPEHFTEIINVQYSGGSNSEYQISNKKSKQKDNWKTFVSDFMYNNDIKYFIGKSRHCNSVLKEIISDNMSRKEKLIAIYNYVTTNFTWNETYWMLPKQSFSSFVKKKTGNSGEINLYLYNLLKAAGFRTFPILTSTKWHGNISKVFPLMEQFNHLMVYTTLDGEELTLSALDKLRPYNVPAINEVMKNALVINEKNHTWIDIKCYNASKYTRHTSLRFVDNKLKGESSLVTTGYLALKSKNKYNDDKDVFLSSLSGGNDYSIDSSKTDYNPNSFRIKTNYSKEDEIPGTLYLYPFKGAIENPFKVNERELPVDMGFPYKKTISHSIYIPENYKIIAKPMNKSFKTPKGKAVFFFQASQSKNVIKISCSYMLKNKDFSKHEYIYFKAFLDEVVKSLEQPIVVKKLDI